MQLVIFISTYVVSLFLKKVAMCMWITTAQMHRRVTLHLKQIHVQAVIIKQGDSDI